MGERLRNEGSDFILSKSGSGKEAAGPGSSEKMVWV